ncbi:unnamed protein product [Sphagnum jensenii]
MSSLRRNHGAVLGMVAMLALVLVIIGAFLYYVSMVLGGSKESSNATDSGALNVGKQALTLTVGPTTSDENQFLDVADSNGQFGLKNIDRVWAKALLASINATAMNNETSAPQATQNAQLLQTAAADISARLSQKLNEASNLYGFFTDYSQSNSVRMLGTKTYVDAAEDALWKTSLMDRGYESNVSANVNELPNNFSAALLQLGQPAKDGLTYLPGYQDIKVSNFDYWFVPYRNGEKTHLVGSEYFTQNLPSTTPLPWTSPVPNAFSVHSQAKGGVGQQSMSWVQTNPQLYFKMQIPQAFIHIAIQKNTLQWSLMGIPVESDDYGFLPSDFEDSSEYPVPTCASVSGTEMCGNEYIQGPTLFSAMFALPPAPPSCPTFTYILQRCQEIIPGYTAGQLTALLTSTTLTSTGADDQDYIIYPSDNSSSATLLCASSSSAPSWTNTDPDGADQILESEGPETPNQGLETFTCDGFPVILPLISTESCDRHWTAGTGYNGCLGKLTIKRTTTAVMYGICSCPI